MRGLGSEILISCWVIVDAPEMMRPSAQPRDERSRGSEPIDPMMPEKAFVLRGEDRLDHVPRHFVQSQLPAETLLHARFAQRNSISIEQRDALHRRAEQGRRNRDEAKTQIARR